MQKIISIIALSSISVCFAVTGTDLSNRIIIDGLSHDFTHDEEILTDSLGNLLEYPADSYWGEYNDVKQIKITWDASYLYLAVDACSYDNNVLLFIDIYDDYGIEDMSELINIANQEGTWNRSFKFYNLNPDFFVGTWDTNDLPELWKVQKGGTMQVEQISTIETSATFNTGNLEGAMEIKIAWEIFFFDGEHSLQNFPRIKLLSVITKGGLEMSSGPDSAPDNLGGMTNDSGQMIVLDNYAEILIDGDGDGLPDMDIEPKKQRTFYKEPPFEAIPLLINNVIFENGKTFAPSIEEEINFELVSNRASEFSVEIFDVNGTFIDYAEKYDDLQWSWDGKNDNGSFVPFGIYILRFIADSGEVSHKEAVVVIK
jgi:hypothetical protein